MKVNKRIIFAAILLCCIILVGTVIAVELDLYKLIVSKNSSNHSSSPTITPVNKTIINSSQYETAPRDFFEFNNVTLSGNVLSMNVAYSGGCKTHDFLLISREEFLESEPVQVHVVLSHDAHQDPCDMYISERLLSYDLTPLQEHWKSLYQQQSGEIIVLIEGLEKPISYQF